MSKLCNNCGSELKEGANVCLNCGKFSEDNINPFKKEIKSNTYVIMLFLSGIFFMLSLFSLLNSYSFGDVWVPEWSDTYWYFTNYIWAVTSVLFGSIALIFSIITIIFGIKKSKYENTISYFIFSLFVLISTVFLLINSFISVGNSIY